MSCQLGEQIARASRSQENFCSLIFIRVGFNRFWHERLIRRARFPTVEQYSRLLQYFLCSPSGSMSTDPKAQACLSLHHVTAATHDTVHEA